MKQYELIGAYGKAYSSEMKGCWVFIRSRSYTEGWTAGVCPRYHC